MKKSMSIFLLFFLCSVNIMAQKYFTKNGNISFFSKTNLEDIKASNNQVVSILNVQTGELQFSVIIKNFQFKKVLMQEHFNENYLETDTYPKATFKGTIAAFNKINFSKDGNYPVDIIGDLSIHGVSNKLNTTGNIIIKSGNISCTAVFNITLADYKISIPKLVESNISKTIEITVNCLYNQKM